jgi:hypothetical protein
MTEQEWLACADAEVMLKVLHRKLAVARSRAGRRRLRLFACASCRTVWHLLDRSAGQEAVRIVEQYADGKANMQAVEAARAAVWALPSASEPSVYMTPAGPSRAHYATITPAHAALPHAYDAARNAVRYAQEALVLPDPVVYAGFLRCIFGNPFHPVSLEPAWITPTLLNLAQAAYDHRLLPSGLLDTARLAVLADALEEGGCADAELLEHLRLAGPHVRGCWPVDLILNKK